MHKFLKVLIFIMVLAPSGLFSQDKPLNKKALDLFMEAKILELQDNYLRALDLYKQVLKIDDAPGVYYTISKLHYSTSKYSDALEYALKALRRDPGNLEYKEHAADVYIMLNDYPNALRLLHEILDLRPNDINILYNIGRIYEVSRQPSEALKIYEKITEDHQYDEIVLMRMINIYENYRDYLNAASAMEKLLYLDPANTILKYRTAAAYISAKDYNNAIRMYENVLSTNPQDQDAQREIIKIYFHTDRANEAFERYGKLVNRDTVDFPVKMSIALAFYEAALDDTTMLLTARSVLENLQTAYPKHWMPEFYLAMIDTRSSGKEPSDEFLDDILFKADTSSEAHVQIGFIYLNRNNFKKAISVFTQGVRSFPDDFRLNYFTGLTYYRLEQNRESIPFLEKAREIAPRDLNVLSALGLVYDNLRMDGDAERIYEQALQYYPDNILLLNNYAYHLSERDKNLKEALEMSKKTIDQEPDNSSYLDTYGWILYKLGDYRNALVYIERAVKLGSNYELLLHLGYVYEKLGDITNAVKYWKESLELKPDQPELRNKLDKYN